MKESRIGLHIVKKDSLLYKMFTAHFLMKAQILSITFLNGEKRQ